MALATNGKPTYSIAAAADQLTRDHVSWTGAPGVGTTLTYAFRAEAPATMPDDTSGFAQFNAAQIRATDLALQAWSDVANIRFSRIGTGAGGPEAYSDSATLRFSDYTSGQEDAAAFTYLPGPLGNRGSNSLQGDAWVNSSLSYNANPQMWAYGQRVLVHEIGHALGLAHPSEYDAGANDAPITYSGDAAYNEDSRQYTVMSYFSESNTGASFRGYYAPAPLLHDIAAIQKLYGVNPTAFVGDTIYGFHSNADRPWFTATSSSSPLIFSVWDAGGTDTFDFSGYSQAQKIDLNAGQFSDVGGMVGNVSIALGAQIENADGGSGGDRIIGNGAANYIRGLDGDDSVAGNGGDDDLNGNVGSDTVDGGEGRDWVRGGQGADIVVGGAGDDPHVNGNLGNDTVYGGAGADTVYGGQGADRLYGDEGDDLLSGDLGDDLLTGGAGADRFVIRPAGGGDWILDFNSQEGDRIQLAPGTAYSLWSVQDQAVVDIGGGTTIALSGVSLARMGDWLVYG